MSVAVFHLELHFEMQWSQLGAFNDKVHVSWSVLTACVRTLEQDSHLFPELVVSLSDWLDRVVH